MFLVVGEGEQSYAELGREIGLREDAVKKAIQRLRKRYHRLFREEIAHTVSTPAEVDEELRHLCAVMSL